MDSSEAALPVDPPVPLSSIYDAALPQVYRYLRARCGSDELAEDLTSATFVQAALTRERDRSTSITIPWLVTVARNKLVDHWRRKAVAERSLTLIEGGQPRHDDPWDEVLDQARTTQVMAMLSPDHQAALTLRYLDDLSVPECADLLGRSVHATESLLVRARRTFRSHYDTTSSHREQNASMKEGGRDA